MRYDAFISYRHSDLDMYIAKKIHKGLETFKVPRPVAQKSGKKSIKRVFRDQEELPIGSDLGDNIEGALRESEFLLVICSPRTPESYWVQKEIETFIRMHDREHVLAILIEGEPDQSFPRQILVDEEGNPVEPLAADVRGTSKKEIDRKLRTELMRLAAPILHCSYDDLRQRHRERRMKKMMSVAAGVAVLGLAFGVYSAYNAAMIRRNYQEKQINQSKYLAQTSLELFRYGDRQSAVLVALEALPSEGNDRPYVASAQYALSEALRSYDMGNVMGMDRSLSHDQPVSTFCFDDSGERVVSIDQGEYIYVWDLGTGKLLLKCMPELDDRGYVKIPVAAQLYGHNLIIADNDGLRCMNLEGEEEWRLTDLEFVLYCEIDPELATAICISNEEVAFVDLENGRVKSRVENHQEEAFSSSYALSRDKKLFAVSHYIWGGSSAGSVTVIDMESGESRDYETAEDYITEVDFTSDNQLVVVSYERSRAENVGVGDIGTAYLEKFDHDRGVAVWTQTVPYQLLGLDGAAFRLSCRELQDDAGANQSQVLLSVDQTAYTWDGDSGELIAQVTVNNGIKSFMVAQTSSFGYLGESSGIIDIVDMTTGVNYTSSAIDTGKNLTDMQIKNGTVVVKAYASPDLTVMKYHQGAGAEEVHAYESRVRDVLYSPEETYYVVRLDTYLEEDVCYFYRTAGNELVGEWRGRIGYQGWMCFIDDGHFVLLNNDGQFVRYDVETGQSDILQVEKEYHTNFEWDGNSLAALCYDSGIFYVLDLQRWEIAETIDVKGDASYVNIYDAELSADGSRIYANLEDQGVVAIETVTGQSAPVSLGEYSLTRRISDLSALTLSEDGALLAVYCTDGMMRIYETKDYELKAEIPFASVNRRYLHFLEDGRRILLQGDDYYLRVYDLEEQKFVYIAAEQYYQIKRGSVDEETNTISLVTGVDMIILNGSTYEPIAQMEDGLAYLPDTAAVFGRDYRVLYRFPYKTLDMLLQEAAEQFGDTRLTELERIRYNVD